jgi:hypothetical protein
MDGLILLLARRAIMAALLTISTGAFLLQSAQAENPTADKTDTKLSGADLEAAHTVLSDFLDTNCVDCHGETKPKGKFQLHDLIDQPFDPADNKRWLNIREMVNTGEMPPPKKEQPAEKDRGAFELALGGLLKSYKLGKSEWELELPRYANRVDHKSLFSGEHKGPSFTKARIWRISGDTYQRLMKDFELGFDFVVPMKKNDTGFHDYSSLYADEATILTMKTNAKRVASTMVKGTATTPPRRGKVEDFVPKFSGPKQKPIQQFIAIKGTPTKKQMAEVFTFLFEFFTKLKPTEAQTDRWITEVLKPNIETAGLSHGLEGTIASILLSPDFLFRVELGQGKELPDGRRMLSPNELSFALSYTLHNHPVDDVLAAAGQGKLKTREDVEREFRKLYNDTRLLRGSVAVGSRDFVWMQSKDHRRGTFSRPKLVQFFQQYFEYAKVTDVFKDDTRHGGKHDPKELIQDADWTVLHVLAEDKNVLEELLTTDRFAVREGNRKKKNRLKPGEDNPPQIHGYQMAYNLTEAMGEPRGKARAQIIEGQRAGILTHPAWLVAHSTNFHTDPVRRGKWILGHLLGYDVPELPIAAQAQLPEWHDKTIRQRFSVVEDEACWRCHKKMNPLGNPFEAYDDFGRYRTKHLVGPNGHIIEAEFEMLNRKNPDRNAIAAEFKIPVNMSGKLFGTGDPALDGPVKNPVELMHKLAQSKRVRQVFIRHLFRYFMGRNESLNDSPTLMAMDKAYLDNGGSLKETLVALVSSDSFLFRKDH